MRFQNGTDVFRKNRIFYGIGCVLILGLKYFGSRAGFEELEWILAPTARWAALLGGIRFERWAGIGYASVAHRFLIAPSCAGLQFLLIAAAMLLFSFVHRTGTKRAGFCWFFFSVAAAWPLTIFVNGLRIVAAVYLPEMLEEAGFFPRWLTPEGLHTAIGAAVYFGALLLVYRAADAWFLKREGKTAGGPGTDRYLLPAFWYFFIVLGIPFLNRAGRKDPAGFYSYAFLLAAVCLPLLLLFRLAGIILKQGHRETAHKNSRP